PGGDGEIFVAVEAVGGIVGVLDQEEQSVNEATLVREVVAQAIPLVARDDGVLQTEVAGRNEDAATAAAAPIQGRDARCCFGLPREGLVQRDRGVGQRQVAANHEHAAALGAGFVRA